MASQKVKTDERIALEQEADKAGVQKRGRHFLSDEQLSQKVIEKKAEVTPTTVVETEPEAEKEQVVAEEKVETKKPEAVAPKVVRKKAPSMNVANIGRDDRTAMVEKLEREDPECKYVMQNSNVTARELAAKGLERTEFSVKNDVVCRTMKDSYEGYQKQKNEASYEAMQRIDGGTGIVGNHEAVAKAPREVQT